ncbi:hypothetical protein [Streptacidiphilus cavernicola]|uniref:HEAT repeat domain-containing protein n=1 Tax=Streptacidiphilus cavernicola TaxID=3342716 RepID=A0ABV6VPR1_9ACTN
MARAMSSSETTLLKDRQEDPDSADGSQPGGTAPLLRAVALQRPADELVQLVAMLNEADQSDYAQQILDTTATLRTVEDFAAVVPKVGSPQAVHALRLAAAQRPVAELAELAALLFGNGQSGYAREVLNTTAAERPVEDIAAMVPLLVDDQAANALHSAAAQRPVAELAELVGHLYGTPDTLPAGQGRWKLRR